MQDGLCDVVDVSVNVNIADNFETNLENSIVPPAKNESHVSFKLLEHFPIVLVHLQLLPL